MTDAADDAETAAARRALVQRHKPMWKQEIDSTRDQRPPPKSTGRGCCGGGGCTLS